MIFHRVTSRPPCTRLTPGREVAPCSRNRSRGVLLGLGNLRGPCQRSRVVVKPCSIPPRDVQKIFPGRSCRARSELDVSVAVVGSERPDAGPFADGAGDLRPWRTFATRGVDHLPARLVPPTPATAAARTDRGNRLDHGFGSGKRGSAAGLTFSIRTSVRGCSGSSKRFSMIACTI